MESVTHDNVIAFLQEYCQQNRLPLPVYDEVCQIGVDHCKQFTMRCKFAEYSITGIDSTKKSAKKVAAKNMVKFLQEKDYFNNSKKAGTKIPPNENIDESETNNMEADNGLKMDFVTPDNVIAFLQEYCQQFNLPLPIYVEVVQKGEDHCKVFTMQCQFGEFSLTGTDRNKKLAKKDAAKNMFKFLQEKDYFKNVLHPSKSKVGIPTRSEVDYGQTTNNTNLKLGGNPIGALQEYCVKFLPLNTFPIYQDVIGASTCFTVSCILLQHITYGSGPQKKIAKSAAAAAMIKKLNEERLEKCEVMEPKMISQSIEIPTVNMNIDALDEIDSTQTPTKHKMGDENIDSSTSES